MLWWPRWVGLSEVKVTEVACCASSQTGLRPYCNAVHCARLGSRTALVALEIFTASGNHAVTAVGIVTWFYFCHFIICFLVHSKPAVDNQSINHSIYVRRHNSSVKITSQRRRAEPRDQSRVNWWDFRARENCSVEVAVLTFGGSRFHVVAAAMANVRSEVLFDVSGFTSNVINCIAVL